MQSASFTQQKSAGQSHGKPCRVDRQQAGFSDRRPQTAAQLRLQELAGASVRGQKEQNLHALLQTGARAVQRAAANLAIQAAAAPKGQGGALPDVLRQGIESLSGIGMDHVRVYYNSPRPAGLQAHAYAQGSEIHLAPGQEKHLPHEAWHVVQQAQGRVRPTLQMKAGVALNDDQDLEREADVMGARAQEHGLVQRALAGQGDVARASAPPAHGTVQRVVYANAPAMWAAVAPTVPVATIMGIIGRNAELQTLYQDILLHLGTMDFVVRAASDPKASVQQNPGGTYDIYYDIPANQTGHFAVEEDFVGAMIHEMAHVASSQLYDTQVPQGETYHIANMHLPVLNPAGGFIGGNIVGDNQITAAGLGARDQTLTMDANWTVLEGILWPSRDFSTHEKAHLQTRLDYARGVAPHAHYDTVLVDLLYYLLHHNMHESHFYLQATEMLREANVRRGVVGGVGAVGGVVPNVPPVAAPAADTAGLHAAVDQLLNDGRWSGKGEALIGHKTPDGIKRLRACLASSANEREALVAVRDAAGPIAQANSPRRIAVTQNAYNALRTDYRAAGLAATIAAVNAVTGQL